MRHWLNLSIIFLISSQSYSRNTCPRTCLCTANHANALHRNIWRSNFYSRQNNHRSMTCRGMNMVPWSLPKDVDILKITRDWRVRNAEKTEISYRSRRDNMLLKENDYNSIMKTLDKIALKNMQRPAKWLNLHSSAIKTLVIEDNWIPSLTKEDLAKFPSLATIQLTNLNLIHISGDSFNNAPHLKVIKITGNKLVEFPKGLFQNKPYLQRLTLSHNRIRAVEPEMLSGTENLQVLDLSENLLDRIPDNFFTQTGHKLATIDLSSNNLKAVPTGIARNKHLKQLKALLLRRNRITRLDYGSFNGTPNVRFLDLSGNNIRIMGIETFNRLAQLQTLDLSANRLAEVPLGSFKENVNLNNLVLSDNKLTVIQGAFKNLKNLRTLKLQNNKLENLAKTDLQHLRKLRSLDLSGNKLRKIGSNTFNGLMGLQRLSIRNNEITTLENDAFAVSRIGFNSKIERLHLDGNYIQELGKYTLYGLPHLKHLNLNRNRIHKVNIQAFQWLRSLKVLLMKRNFVRRLVEGMFKGTSLEKLNLRMNIISTIPHRLLAGLGTMRYIDLSSNNIDNVPELFFKHVNRLQKLYMDNNKLKKLNIAFLTNELPHCRYFSFANNMLSEVRTAKLKQSRDRLRYLNLANNRLQKIDIRLVSLLESNAYLGLSGNTWDCDCRLRWLNQLGASKRLNVLDKEYLICQKPPPLHGAKIMELPSTSFTCTKNTTQADKH